MVWYKFFKEVSHSPVDIEYVWLDDNDGVKEECELWARKRPGGHNTQYSYGFERAKPPVKILKEMIKETNGEIKYTQKHLAFLNKELKKVKK